MEPVVNKLQEGVKYPRFERDATKTINDLVEHITKERGVYSSSIEPNPNEHNIWFNTNDNTLYISNKGVWKPINNDNNIDMLYEPSVFYCSGGVLYYYPGYNQNKGEDGIYISGLYTEKRLKYLIENNENKPIENMTVDRLIIEPEDDSKIIIGDQIFYGNLTIACENVAYCNIYMYDNILRLGSEEDSIYMAGVMNLNECTIFCNCGAIGDITITHEGSTLDLMLNPIYFVVGNNNRLTIDQSIGNAIEDCFIYVVKETDNDKSKIFLPRLINGVIVEYINLCGTAINGGDSNSISIKKFITTTIDDIDKANMEDSCVHFDDSDILIVDAPYRTFNHLEFIDYLKTCNNLSVYVTDEQLFNFLKGRGMKCEMAIANNSYYDDKILVNYKTTDGTSIYNTIIFKR